MESERRKSKFNILVVEDDDRIFNVLKEGLADTNYKLWQATTGREALRLAKEGYFITIISEIRLKDIDGIELVRRLKKIEQKINIIVLTAYSIVNPAIEAMKNGAFAYLTKPLNMEEVKLVLRRSIENTILLIKAGQRKFYQDISIIDGLTGIYNHRHFYEMLDWSISHLRRFPQSFSLFFIDIDDFKKYNDTHGHVEGDKVLHNLAQLFINSTRDSDMVFRYGGEEFAIILPQTDFKNAQIVAQRLLNTVREHSPVTISIGVATFPTHAQTKNDLVVRADKSLYQAKAAGKNRVCAFEEKADK